MELDLSEISFHSKIYSKNCQHKSKLLIINKYLKNLNAKNLLYSSNLKKINKEIPSKSQKEIKSYKFFETLQNPYLNEYCLKVANTWAKTRVTYGLFLKLYLKINK